MYPQEKENETYIVEKGNWYDKHYYFLIIISMLSFVAFGIDPGNYILHNLTQHFIFSSKIHDYSALTFDYAHILRVFNSTLKYILLAPAGYIIAGIVFRFISFLCVFHIFKLIIKDKFQALFATLLFSVSHLAANYFKGPSFLWVSPVFTYQSFAGVCIFLGILFSLKQRFIPAALAFSLSLHVHIIDGITAFSFFLAGFIFWVNARNIKIKELAAPALIILLNLGYFAFYYTKLKWQVPEVPVSQWHAFLYNTEGADPFIYYAYTSGGFFLVPLIGYAGYLLKNNRERDCGKFSRFIVGPGLLLCLLLGIELVHNAGYFIPKISEVLISLEFRRGQWVLYLFCLAVTVKNIFAILSQEGTPSNKKLLLTGLFFSVYLYPTLPNISILICCINLMYFNRNVLLLDVIFLLAIFVFFYERIWVNYFGLKSTLFALSCVIISTIIFFGASKKINYKAGAISICIFMMLIFCFQYNYYQPHKLADEIRLVANKGFFQYPDYAKLIKGVACKSQKDIDFCRAAELLNLRTKNEETVLTPPGEMYPWDYLLLAAPIYINYRVEATAVQSKAMFSYYIYKARDLYGMDPFIIFRITEKLDYHESGAIIQSRLTQLYNDLPVERLKYLSKKYNVRFILTEKQYDKLPLIYKGTYYNIYDLSKNL